MAYLGDEKSLLASIVITYNTRITHLYYSQGRINVISKHMHACMITDVTDVGHDLTGNTLTARFDTNSTSSGPSLMTWLKHLEYSSVPV